jgi:hypothetical protein
VHRAAADVDDQHRALAREIEAVAERSSHRLVQEAKAFDAERVSDLLDLGAVGLKRRDRRRDDEVADALASGLFHVG